MEVTPDVPGVPPGRWRDVLLIATYALSRGLSVHRLPVFKKTRHGSKNNFREGGSGAQQSGQLLDYRSR